MTDYDDVLEQRLHDMYAQMGNIKTPPLTQQRLEALRTLIPSSLQSVSVLPPTVFIIWKKAVDKVQEVLTVLKTAGVAVAREPGPLFRDGEKDDTRIEQIILPLNNGELHVKIISGERRRARLLLSVKGSCVERTDLSVELATDQRLLEARPLEQKAELTLEGTGRFTLSLYGGDEVLGDMRLEIGADGEHSS